jgi:glutathione S-transferase
VVAARSPVNAPPEHLPVLWQLRFSHYNEKARWALDYKGVAHRRHSLAPGSHRYRARRLWGGDTTPVLELQGEMIGDTTAIIAALESVHPERPLYPAGEADRERALALEDHFDTELGPYIRGAVFDATLPYRKEFVEISTQGLSRRTQLMQRALSPLAGRVVRRLLVEGPGGPEVCREKTVAAMDRLDAELNGNDYLVGDGFTVADLTAAALFFPLVSPPEFQYDLPEPWPPEWEEFRRSLADRPGYGWALEMYRRHRGSSAELPQA